jgi:hypothetical protein
MIKRITEFSEFERIFEWINESNLAYLRDKKSYLMIPPYFASYCLILHPIYVNKRAETGPRIPWVKMTREERIRTAKIDSPRPPIQGRRIRWGELAEENGLIFHPEINLPLLLDVSRDGLYPLRFYGPEEGSLDEPTCKELIHLLKPYTGNQTCYFEYFVLATSEIKSDQLYSGELEDVAQLVTMDTVRGSPTYWWSQNHSWCLYSPYDSNVTILGGSQEIIDSIILSDELETLQVGLNLDWSQDKINEKQFNKLKKHQKNRKHSIKSALSKFFG